MEDKLNISFMKYVTFLIFSLLISITTVGQNASFFHNGDYHYLVDGVDITSNAAGILLSGDDIIFGDSINTDALADNHDLNTQEGAGWETFDQLESGQSALRAAWDRADTTEYIRENADELAEESTGSEDDGREGGVVRVGVVHGVGAVAVIVAVLALGRVTIGHVGVV